MTKVRIVKRTYPDDSVRFVIQQKHWILWWMWVDAWLNSWMGAMCLDTFFTLKEAETHLCYFDGTKIKDEEVK